VIAPAAGHQAALCAVAHSGVEPVVPDGQRRNVADQELAPDRRQDFQAEATKNSVLARLSERAFRRRLARRWSWLLRAQNDYPPTPSPPKRAAQELTAPLPHTDSRRVPIAQR